MDRQRSLLFGRREEKTLATLRHGRSSPQRVRRLQRLRAKWSQKAKKQSKAATAKNTCLLFKCFWFCLVCTLRPIDLVPHGMSGEWGRLLRDNLCERLFAPWRSIRSRELWIWISNAFHLCNKFHWTRVCLLFNQICYSNKWLEICIKCCRKHSCSY